MGATCEKRRRQVALLHLACLLLLILRPCLCAGARAEQSWRDDFASYPDASTGEPAWVTDSVMWETRGGAFGCASPALSFAIYAPAPYSDGQVVEAIVSVSGTTTDQWKISGVVIYQDNGNYWHLALVESPRVDGARHFTELAENYGGTWLAHGAPETKLTQIESAGTSFKWRYDHPYRLRLRLTVDLIEGTISELSGEVVSRTAYRLDNSRAVRAGNAGLDSSGFSARFDDFRLEVTSTMTAPAKPTPPATVAVRSWNGVRSRATGFFRVAERGRRWWLFDPRGRAFYLIGTDHASYNVHWCEKLGYAPYHRNMVEKFGSEEAWAKSTLARLQAWGFNTVAANHSTFLRHQGLAHMVFLGLGGSFAAQDDICPQVHWTGFPNVFSPKWKQHCRKQARQQCGPVKDDPWLIGYFFDNELEWYGKSYRPWGLADEAFKKPATHTAKIALVKFLRDRYHRDIAAFNRAWGVHVRSFDSLLRRRRPIAEDSAATRADKMAFVRLIAERYFAGCAEAIREFDPNHLLLGCRFAGEPPDVWDIAGRHCDIVSVNCYRQADLDRRRIIGFEDDLRRWHQAARRPLMITEWSFPALDSGLPCKHGAGQRFDTQQQRAAAWRTFQELLFRTPYVVGSDYFMWADEPALGISSTFPEDTNYGLVNERDEPYVELTETATRVNDMVYEFHAGRVAELRPMFSETPPRLKIRNNGGADAEAVVRIWVDGAQRDTRIRVSGASEVGVAFDLPTAPGAHFAQCMVDPDAALPEGDRSDNEAHIVWYAPGLEAPVPGGAAVPLVVANPTDENLDQALVHAPTPTGLHAVDAWHPQAGWITCSADDKERTLRLLVPNLLAHSAQAVLLTQAAGKHAFTREPLKDPLALTVAPGRAGEEEAATLLLSGERIGGIVPLIQQRTVRDQWVRPRLESQGGQELGPWLRVRAVLSCDPRERRSVIGRHDQPGQSLDLPRAFSCGYDIEWVRGRPWFSARLQWLRSDDPGPWECPNYFHYLLPDFAADAAGPDVPNYHRPFAGWWDKQCEIGIGVVTLAPDDFTLSFWKDEGGGLHPDAYRQVGRRFAKGAMFDERQPEIVVFATRGEPFREASLRIWRHARAERMLDVLLIPVERGNTGG